MNNHRKKEKIPYQKGGKTVLQTKKNPALVYSFDKNLMELAFIKQWNYFCHAELVLENIMKTWVCFKR